MKLITKIFMLVSLTMFFSLLIGCNKKNDSENPVEENSEQTMADENSETEEINEETESAVSWTEFDLECYLTGTEKWTVDNSNLRDIFRSDGTFGSGFEEKGTIETGTWKVISPNAVELLIGGQREIMMITSISANSFTWGDDNHVSSSDKTNFDDAFIARINQFNLELTNTYTTEITSTEEYFYFDDLPMKTVTTDDGSNVNYRAEPITGDVMGKFANGTTVLATKRTQELFVIDDKSDYWYFVTCYADIEPYGGWVYGGYLVDTNVDELKEDDDLENPDEEIDSDSDERKKFFSDGIVINTMYVDATDGLKVRDKPNLESNKLCSLVHRMPVKVISIGKDLEIDGKVAPWIEILLPKYEWKSSSPEYGWVYGGYLSKTLPKFSVPSNSNELKNYLTRQILLTVDDENCCYWEFHRDGTYKYENALSDEDCHSGTYVAKSKNTVELTTTSAGNSFPAGKHVIKFSEMTDVGSRFSYDDSPDIFGSRIATSLTPHVLNEGIYCDYYDYESKPVTFMKGHEDFYKSNPEYLASAIAAGISAAGTSFESQYNSFWEPIMKAHQEKTNSMH